MRRDSVKIERLARRAQFLRLGEARLEGGQEAPAPLALCLDRSGQLLVALELGDLVADGGEFFFEVVAGGGRSRRGVVAVGAFPGPFIFQLVSMFHIIADDFRHVL